MTSAKTLLTYAGPGVEDGAGFRIGGVPLVLPGFLWPRCGRCGRPMQFLAQLEVPGTPYLLTLFMCQNDPGMCDEWSATSGGNMALLFEPGDFGPAVLPGWGNTVLAECHAVELVTVPVEAGDGEDDGGYWQASRRWADGSDHPATHVLGSLGGTPAWLQDEEVPECYSCLRPMGFVAQLEEGPGLYPALNFGGGGRGYAFACASCGTAFLWQC